MVDPGIGCRSSAGQRWCRACAQRAGRRPRTSGAAEGHTAGTNSSDDAEHRDGPRCAVRMCAAPIAAPADGAARGRARRGAAVALDFASDEKPQKSSTPDDADGSRHQPQELKPPSANRPGRRIVRGACHRGAGDSNSFRRSSIRRRRSQGTPAAIAPVRNCASDIPA